MHTGPGAPVDPKEAITALRRELGLEPDQVTDAGNIAAAPPPPFFCKPQQSLSRA